MRILAIDPAPEKSAIVAMRLNDLDGLWQASGSILDNDLLLAELDSYNRGVWKLAIEDIQWYGPTMTAGQSTFQTAKWIGRFVQCWTPGVATMVYRTTIKAHVSGLAKAKDPQVRQCLIDRWGEPGTKKAPNPVTYGIKKDMWSALAVATWFLDTHGNSD